MAYLSRNATPKNETITPTLTGTFSEVNHDLRACHNWAHHLGWVFGAVDGVIPWSIVDGCLSALCGSFDSVGGPRFAATFDESLRASPGDAEVVV